MPRFYFDVDAGSGIAIDRVGLVLANAEAAHAAAISILPDIAREGLSEVGGTDLASTVRDSDGKSIFTASLTLRSRCLP